MQRDPKSCVPLESGSLQLLLQSKAQLVADGNDKFLLSDQQLCLEKKQAKIRHAGALHANRLEKIMFGGGT